MDKFLVDFPQIHGGSLAITSANCTLLTEDLKQRVAFPIYQEWIASLVRLATAVTPKLQLACPDGVVRTGRSLKEAVQKWPIELLEPQPKKLSHAQAQSAGEFLAEHPELQDNRPPALLLERFHNEFARFLKSDVGRAWHRRMSQYKHDNTARMADYMEAHGLEFTQKGFEVAAVAISDEISVTLT
jgi:hypothetical protein